MTLYIFSGLPGSGKSTLARSLAQQLSAVWLRIDTIEQGLRDLCDFNVEGEGYRLAYRIAADNLQQGISVVADSCNPIKLTRREWEEVALNSGTDFVNVEVICSNGEEHRQRVETRRADVSGLTLPDWAAVMNREYHDWTVERTVVDTAGRTESESLQDLMNRIR